VIKVNVGDNQWVEKGTVLVEIDPRDYEVAVEQAQANLAVPPVGILAPPCRELRESGRRIQRAGETLEIVVILAHGSARLQPFGLGGGSSTRRLNLNEFHHNSIVAALISCPATNLAVCRQPKPFCRIKHLCHTDRPRLHGKT